MTTPLRRTARHQLQYGTTCRSVDRGAITLFAAPPIIFARSPTPVADIAELRQLVASRGDVSNDLMNR